MAKQRGKKTKKTVENNLRALIEEYDLSDQLSVDKVKEWVYESGDVSTIEASRKYNEKVLSYFPDIPNIDEINRVLMVFVDAWNYFPHKSLQARAPNEMVDELKKMEEKKTEEHFKYAEENLDEYLDWAGKNVLPNYEKHLKQGNLSEEEIEGAMGVASAFIEQCGRMGFFDFAAIHPGFFSDFPDMVEIQDTEKNVKIRKKDVETYLKDFLNFLRVFYGIKTSEL